MSQLPTPASLGSEPSPSQAGPSLVLEPVSKNEMADYRKHLVAAEQKAQEDFDKTVLSLSGGALGISFVFLKDVVGPSAISKPDLLFAAWVSWGLSTFFVLTSYYTSHLALRKAIDQVDAGSISASSVGGIFRHVTAFCNAAGAVLFLAGVCSITFFASANLKPKGATSDQPQTAASPTKAASAPAASTSKAASGSGG